MAKKQRIDLGKGFKRIFYVAASIWAVVIIILILVRWDECEPYPNYTIPARCVGETLGGRLFEGLIFWIVSLIAVVVAYRFLKWIGAGFKK